MHQHYAALLGQFASLHYYIDQVIQSHISTIVYKDQKY